MDETLLLYALMALLGGVVIVLTCADLTDKTGMSYHHALAGNERARAAGAQTVRAAAQDKKAK
jgi:hypothetical protein